MPDHETLQLNPEAKPYATYLNCPESSECYYCDEGMELDVGHTHEIYETCEGASHFTADELADVFLNACEYCASSWKRPEYCPRDIDGWCDDPDDSQALSDCIMLGESALGDVGLYVTWNDGFTIERITEGES